ncbi:MAG: hypothetical protein LC725_12245 [Lentisphaerae bacterium]|nr:hypothetical protein [Lentisphaerota bacterium]
MDKAFKPAPITITLADGHRIKRRPGICAGELEICSGRHLGYPVIACLVNNEVCSLRYPLEVNSRLAPLTVRDRLGWRVYRDSLAFLLAKVTAELAAGQIQPAVFPQSTQGGALHL